MSSSDKQPSTQTGHTDLVKDFDWVVSGGAGPFSGTDTLDVSILFGGAGFSCSFCGVPWTTNKHWASFTHSFAFKAHFRSFQEDLYSLVFLTWYAFIFMVFVGLNRIYTHPRALEPLRSDLRVQNN